MCLYIYIHIYIYIYIYIRCGVITHSAKVTRQQKECRERGLNLPPPPFLAKRQEDLSMIFSQNLNFQEKLLTLKILNDLENCKNGTKKGKKLLRMKNNNYIICHTPYLRNNLAYDHDFWRTCVKSWCLQVSDSCYWNFHFFGLWGG